MNWVYAASFCVLIPHKRRHIFTHTASSSKVSLSRVQIEGMAIFASDKGSVSRSGGRSPVAWSLQTQKSWPWGCRSASRARGRAKYCALVSSDSLPSLCPTAGRTSQAIGQAQLLFLKLLLPHCMSVFEHVAHFCMPIGSFHVADCLCPRHSSRQKGKFTGIDTSFAYKTWQLGDEL